MPQLIRRVVTGLLVLACGGCTYEKVVYDPWSDFEQEMGKVGLVDKTLDEEPKATVQEPLNQGWIIPLASFAGANGDRQAGRLAKRLAAEHRLKDVGILAAAEGFTVYRGPFPHNNSDEAQNILRQTRMLKVDGLALYEGAEFVKVDHGKLGPSGDLDLRQHQGLFSLQIGYYDEQFGPKFRQAAEQAAKALRKEGEEAYYYHGPHHSLVTIGVFTEEDFSADGYGHRVKEIQERFPHNLGNGRVMTEKPRGMKAREQTSFLVRVIEDL